MLLSAQPTRDILHSYEDVIVISLFKFKVYDQIIIFQKKHVTQFLISVYTNAANEKWSTLISQI